MNRRDFLTALAATTPALAVKGHGSAPKESGGSDSLGTVLPKRILGRTGEAVTMLGIGGYHTGWTAERDAMELVETAIEQGIRFFDTAHNYQDGESETRYGKYLVPKYRDHIFLMTKTAAGDGKSARKELETSLRRLNTDHLDLLQMHSLRDPADADSRIDNGVVDALLQARAEGKVRYIGFTGHSNPEAHLRMLERTRDTDPFDTCQMPVNAVDASYHSFSRQVIPRLRERNIGLLAMKTLADGRFFGLKTMPGRGVIWQSENPVIPGRISIRDALHFSWSLPVSVLITGAENASLVREKADFLRTFAGLSEEARAGLVARVADLAADGKVEYYKRPVGDA